MHQRKTLLALAAAGSIGLAFGASAQPVTGNAPRLSELTVLGTSVGQLSVVSDLAGNGTTRDIWRGLVDPSDWQGYADMPPTGPQPNYIGMLSVNSPGNMNATWAQPFGAVGSETVIQTSGGEFQSGNVNIGSTGPIAMPPDTTDLDGDLDTTETVQDTNGNPITGPFNTYVSGFNDVNFYDRDNDPFETPEGFQFDDGMLIIDPVVFPLNNTGNTVTEVEISIGSFFTDSFAQNGLIDLFILPAEFDVSTVTYEDLLAASTPQFLLGDADGNGQVDGNDLLAVEQNFGNTGAAGILGDADNNGQVDGNDLLAVEQNFGNTSAPAAANAVPEPAALSLLGFAGVAALRRRRA